MEFRVLGPIEALHSGVPLALGGPKQRSVLALLVASAGRPVSVGVLIEGVYGDDATDGARRTIHTYVSNLRREVGDVIARAGDGYLLEAADVDAVRFEELYRAGSTAVADDPARASRQLREALALWRGHAYGDVEGRSRLDAEISRLEELRLAAIDARIEADLALGLHRDLIGELEALSAEHPLRESFRAHHMLALYRSGRQSEALRAFGRTRTLLAEELGIDPSPTLQEMEEAILTQDPKLDVRIKAVVETRAILAAELDDALAFQSMADRDAALERRDAALVLAASAQSGQMLGVSGSAAYAWFPDVARALTAATTLPLGLVRVAIDHGEVEVSDRGVVGAPVVRALRLAAVAHPGQVLISADAHAHLARQAEGGWVLKTLGRYSIRGLDADAAVFQLIARGLAEEFPELLLDRLPPPMPGTGVSVPGFELRGEMGGGTVGMMHRAYQPSVGREVAVRVIRPELVTDARFIRRFEAETQRIAGIEHPHLVPLLDHWREPTAAYLVYRLMRGGDLRTLIDTAPPSFEEGVDLVEKMGAALHAAHGAGVVHGRVRPENVLFDRDANPHLADLGVAAMFEGLAAFPADAYTAPETIHGQPTVAADVYSLGALTAELLSGRMLPVDRGLPSVGEAVDRVIARATHPDLAVRHSTVLSFLEDLASAIPTRFPGVPVRSGTVNPYRGLATFRETDAAHFFGRRTMVDTLVGKLAERSLMLVVGPSGIGKSSVVRAGLVPALRRGALPGSDSWLVADLFPGSRPFEELESALDQVAVTPSGEAVEDVRTGRCSLEAVAGRVLPAGSNLLLVIDQFEELWTHLADDAQRRRFLEILTEVATNPASAVKVVATMRADFYDRPLQHAGFGEVAADATVAVAVPTDAELAEIVRGPAAAVRVNVTDALVELMVADAGEEPGALPLLQYVLTEMFDNREFDLLDPADYRNAGGLIGSIGRRAEHIYLGFSPEERTLARDVFVRLVTVDEDSEDTRRRVRRSELELLGGGGGLDRVLEAFGRHRLLVFDRDAATRGPTVEVAHEALLSQWGRLAGWIDEARHDLLTRRRIEIAAREWAEAGADPSYLLGGARLEQAEAWAAGSGMHVSDDEAAFLAESRRVVDAERARRRRDRRRVLTGLSTALVIAVGFGSVATVQRAVAEQDTLRARIQELSVEARAAADLDPDRGILLALEAYELSQSLADERTPGDVMAAMQVASQSSRVFARLIHGYANAAMSADGRFVAFDNVEPASQVDIYNTVTLERERTLDVGAPVGRIDFDPSGSYLAVAHSDPLRGLPEKTFAGSPSVSVFDASDFHEIYEITGFGLAYDVSWSHDGRFLAVELDESTAIFEPNGDLVGHYPLYGKWVPGSSELAYPDGEGVTIVEVPSGIRVDRIDTPGVVPSVVAPAADGTGVGIGVFSSREVQWWRPDSMEPSFAFISPGIQSVQLDSTGRFMISQGNDDAVVFTDMSSGQNSLVLRGHQGGSYDVAVTPDLTRAFIPTFSGTLVWDLTPAGPRELENIDAVGDLADMMLLEPAGHIAVTATEGRSGHAEILDLASGMRRSFFDGLEAKEFLFAPKTAPSGEVIGIDASTRLTTVFDPSGVPLFDEFDPCETPAGISGEYALAAVSHGTCRDPGGGRIVDFETGDTVFEFAAGFPVLWVEFGRVGTIAEGLAVASRDFSEIEVISLERGEVIGSIDGTEYLPFVPRMSPDGRWAVFGSQLGGIIMVDVAAILSGSDEADWVHAIEAGVEGPTSGAVAGSTLAASTHSGKSVRVFDIASGALWFEVPIETSNSATVAFTSDERFLYYEDADGLIRRLPLDPAELAEVARSRLTRDFTVAECERFLIDADCSVYQET